MDVGHSVTFVSHGPSGGRGVPTPNPTPQDASAPNQNSSADLILVSCVKEKRPDPAPAKDLYTSPLFARERRHAEASGKPWFILSAKHGLVDPDQVLEPYDLRLSDTPPSYQSAWGHRVVQKLAHAAGPLRGKTIEVHAGVVYTNSIRGPLRDAGADLIEPLEGLTMGRRLAWYGRTASSTDSPTAQPLVLIEILVDRLRDGTRAQSPAAFLETQGRDTRTPGLYSWWVDAAGAADLTAGLGTRIEPGLIYAGLAGATRSKSGKKSTNTLWGRIRGMHLGGNHHFSTFSSLGSILAATRRAHDIDEDALTEWMHQHLQLISVPVDDVDRLDALETAILTALDPPLNLDKMPTSDVRTRLSQLRRQHNRR